MKAEGEMERGRGREEEDEYTKTGLKKGGRKGGRNRRIEEERTRDTTHNKFDGQLIPPCDVIMSKDIRSHLSHVFRVLFTKDLHASLVAPLKGLLYAMVIFQHVQDDGLGTPSHSLSIPGKECTEKVIGWGDHKNQVCLIVHSFNLLNKANHSGILC